MWKDSRDQCSIRNDDFEISNALGISKKRWLKAKAEILRNGDPILAQKSNKLISKKLQKISKKMKDYRKKQAEKGKKSGLTRGTTVEPRLNHSSTIDEPKGEPKGNSSSSSSSSSSNAKDKKKNNMSQNFEKKWNELIKIWPTGAKGKLNTCRVKFNALCKQGKLEEFIKIQRGYFQFLEYRDKVEHFPQKCMHLSTFLNNWEADKEQYIGFEYKARL